MSDPKRLRARVAGLSRTRDAEDPEVLKAKAELRTTMLEDHIRRVVDGWPPLSAEQRSRLAGILRPDLTRTERV